MLKLENTSGDIPSKWKCSGKCESLWQSIGDNCTNILWNNGEKVIKTLQCVTCSLLSQSLIFSALLWFAVIWFCFTEFFVILIWFVLFCFIMIRLKNMTDASFCGTQAHWKETMCMTLHYNRQSHFSYQLAQIVIQIKWIGFGLSHILWCLAKVDEGQTEYKE